MLQQMNPETATISATICLVGFIFAIFLLICLVYSEIENREMLEEQESDFWRTGRNQAAEAVTAHKIEKGYEGKQLTFWKGPNHGK